MAHRWQVSAAQHRDTAGRLRVAPRSAGPCTARDCDACAFLVLAWALPFPDSRKWRPKGRGPGLLPGPLLPCLGNHSPLNEGQISTVGDVRRQWRYPKNVSSNDTTARMKLTIEAIRAIEPMVPKA
jgi:hypothetical protein